MSDLVAGYPPGTVAVATVLGVEGVRVMRTDASHAALCQWVSVSEVEGSRLHTHDEVADVRPLVVLDLDDVGRCCGFIPHSGPGGMVESVLALLRDETETPGRKSLTRELRHRIEEQTRPPKPPEPRGLGAVVEDTRGQRWTRYDTNDPQPWWLDMHGMDAPVERRYSYVDIDVTRVLSEGVRDA